MKNLVKTEFDSWYDKLSLLNEDIQLSLFNTPEYIYYFELEDYFDKYFFNPENKADTRKYLFPQDPKDEWGWETLNNLKLIEQKIEYNSERNRGLARIVAFYNTYILEHWLNKQYPGLEFAPDANTGNEIQFNSKEVLVGISASKDAPADFSYSKNGVNGTADLKAYQGKNDKPIFHAHNADKVLAFNPWDNTIRVYNKGEYEKRTWQDKNNQEYTDQGYAYTKDETIKPIAIPADIIKKLIPPYIVEYGYNGDKDFYRDWNKIFSKCELNFIK